MDIYVAALAALPPKHITHHRSDLFILMSQLAMPIIRQFRMEGGKVEEIQDKDSELFWYYIPWGYTPYWHKRFRSMIEDFAWEFFTKNARLGTLTDLSSENLDSTFAGRKAPPPRNFYPAIRLAINGILSTYDVNPRLTG